MRATLPRGVCVIINNYRFLSHRERPGSEKDYKDLIEIFENTLGFQIEKGENLTKQEILRLLRKVQNLDHTKYSALFVIIMTHGDKHAIYASDDQKIDINDMILMFTTAKCPRLKDKPKVFLLQTCQGNTDTASSSTRSHLPSEYQHFQASTHNIADFLIGYATVCGAYSMRNVMTGTWYIQEFCEALKSYSHEEDLVRILTRVNDRVKKMSSDGITQQPHFDSQLGKLLYLRPICQTMTKQHQMVVPRDEHENREKGSDKQNGQAQNNGWQKPLEPNIIVVHGNTTQQQELKVHSNNSQPQEQASATAPTTAEIVVHTARPAIIETDSKPPLRGEALDRRFIVTCTSSLFSSAAADIQYRPIATRLLHHNR